MSDSLSKHPIAGDSVSSMISSENFSKFSENNQKAALESLSNNKDKEGGWMGKLFGNKKENAAMNIVVVLCVILVIVGCICSATGKDYWKMIIPSITTGMGYMFGKHDA